MMRRTLTLLASTLLCVAASAQSIYGGTTDGAGFSGAMAAVGSEFLVGSAPVGWPYGHGPAGLVYRYVREAGSTDGNWVEAGSIQASDGAMGDDFGRSLFASGSTLAVGAPGVGAVYLFERGAAGTWSETGKVTPSALAEGAEFGGTYAKGGLRTGNITMASGRLAVTSFNSKTLTGAVHVFIYEDGIWREEAVLKGEDGGGFGHAISGTLDGLFVGVSGANEGAGAVDVYTVDDGNWSLASRLTPADLDASSDFGQALAATDGRLYAGASGAGTVIVFEKDGSQKWAETGRLAPPESVGDQPVTAEFGSGVTATGNAVLVGAKGTAFLFEGQMVSRLDPPDDRSRTGFGTGLVIGRDAVMVGSPSADYGEGIATVFEKSDIWEAAGTLAPEVKFLESIRGEQIDCEEGKASAFDCKDVDMVSFVSSDELSTERGVKMTDLWGWEDPQTGGEWVIQARSDGVAFVDISDASYPVVVGELLRTEGSPGATWRDVKVYKDHAFIVADGSGEHGVQIFDLTQLRDVSAADMPVTFQETAHYAGVASTHNIVINEDTGFAYAVGNRAGGETCNGQMHMIDIRDPVNPVFAGCNSEDASKGTHDAQCVIYRGADANYQGHEICLSSNGSSFVIADVTDKESPTTVSINTYPLTHYTHQGWLNEDHNYFYMNDELDEMNGAVERTRTLIWDVQDLEDPQLVNQFYLDSGASDHNLYIRGNLMYQSNYQAGLRILDISDPMNPVEVGSFDTSPYSEDAPGFGGSWSNYPYFKSGVIAVSSKGEGLFILKKRKVDS
ncbi:MAG: choice-of-anchor B domain-containing protein [Rhodothermales bacterium]|jgi:choice-of-anchor B domain-containing protein